MTNINDFKGQRAPASLAHLDPGKSHLSEGIPETGMNMLTYRAKEWRLRFDKQEYDLQVRSVDLILVRAAPYTSRIYFPKWDNRQDAAAGQQPICFSLKGDVPDPFAPMPQHATCSGCQRDAWIFKDGGNRGKECQSNRRVAVYLLPGSLECVPPAVAKELKRTTVFFKIPPGSFQALIQYDKTLQHRGFHHAAVVTRIGFDPKKQFCLSFEQIKVLNEQEGQIVARLQESDEALRITGERQSFVQIEAADEEKWVEPPRQVNTGLAEAFADEEDEEVLPPPPPPAKIARPVGRPRKIVAPEPAHNEAVEESDSTVDANLRDMLSKRVEDMLK